MATVRGVWVAARAGLQQDDLAAIFNGPTAFSLPVYLEHGPDSEIVEEAANEACGSCGYRLFGLLKNRLVICCQYERPFC